MPNGGQYLSNLSLRMFNRERPLEFLSGMVPFYSESTYNQLRPDGTTQTWPGTWSGVAGDFNPGQIIATNATSTGTLSNPVNWETVRGSNISYLPPEHTDVVIYRYNFSVSPQSGISDVILHFALLIDSVEVTAARQTIRIADNGTTIESYRQGIQCFEYPIRIIPGWTTTGTFTNATAGVFNSWTTPKDIRLRVANYGSAYRGQLNQFRNHLIPDSSVFGGTPLINSTEVTCSPNLTLIPIRQSGKEQIV